MKKGYDIAAIPLNITPACCFSVYDIRKMFRLTLMLRRFETNLCSHTRITYQLIQLN